MPLRFGFTEPQRVRPPRRFCRSGAASVAFCEAKCGRAVQRGGALCADGGVSQSGRGSGDNKSRRVVGDHHHTRRLFCFIIDMRTPPEGARRRFASQISSPPRRRPPRLSQSPALPHLPQRRVSKVVAENRFTRRIGIVHARSINSFDIFCEVWYTN